MMHPMEVALRKGLGDLALRLDDTQIDQLLAYQDLIQKWTRVYNLTAVRDPAEMLTRHLLDSLAIISSLQVRLARKNSAVGQGGEDLSDLTAIAGVPASAPAPARLLDVGSGAGLPGIVIAVCCPHITVHCVDTVAKKAAFIQQVAASLRLSNLRGIHARVESLTEQYEVVTSRAFASLADFVTWSHAALAPQGIWMGMKGKHPADEMAALPSSVKVFHVEQLAVPGLDAERCIVWMRKAQLLL